MKRSCWGCWGTSFKGYLKTCFLIYNPFGRIMVWLGDNPNRMPTNQHKDSAMKTYANAAELITAIRTALDKYSGLKSQ